MSFGTAYATKKRCAKGGEVKGVHKPMGYLKETQELGHSYAGNALRESNKHKEHGSEEGAAAWAGEAKKVHAKKLQEMKSMPKPNLPMAEGGEASEHEQDADMIARIMHKRKEYAKGGEVANDVGVAEADELPAEFDAMELDDHLEDDSAAGNEKGDADVSDDPIDRVMMKRKKDKLPKPA